MGGNCIAKNNIGTAEYVQHENQLQLAKCYRLETKTVLVSLNNVAIVTKRQNFAFGYKDSLPYLLLYLYM